MLKPSYAIAAALLLAAGAWWLLHDDPEARVREAHMTLADMLRKSADSDDGLSILQLRSLEALFAERVVISGDAGRYSTSYTPQEIVSLIVQIRAVFASIEIGFGELAIDLPASDSAVARFSAELDGEEGTTGELVFEARSVESHMRRVDGDWQFSEFVLSDLTAPR